MTIVSMYYGNSCEKISSCWRFCHAIATRKYRGLFGWSRMRTIIELFARGVELEVYPKLYPCVRVDALHTNYSAGKYSQWRHKLLNFA